MADAVVAVADDAEVMTHRYWCAMIPDVVSLFAIESRTLLRWGVTRCAQGEEKGASDEVPADEKRDAEGLPLLLGIRRNSKTLPLRLREQAATKSEHQRMMHQALDRAVRQSGSPARHLAPSHVRPQTHPRHPHQNRPADDAVQRGLDLDVRGFLVSLLAPRMTGLEVLERCPSAQHVLPHLASPHLASQPIRRRKDSIAGSFLSTTGER